MFLTPVLLAAAAAWGHLPPQWLLEPGQRAYLVNQPPGVPWRVCVDAAAMRSFPSLGAEIDAAVNVWAGYVGRRVPVSIETKELGKDRPKGRDSLRERLAARCGDAHLLVAFAALAGQALGETGFKRRTTLVRRGSKTLSETNEISQRYLFLRDLDAAPLHDGDDAPSLRWAAFPALALGSSPLDTLRARKAVSYAVDGRVAMLAVLVHEIGHVWGLCDLYDSEQLCDPRHSGETRLPEGRYAAMGAVFFRQQLYLADDDIVGIRELVKRPGFDAAWKDKSVAWPTPPKVVLPDVEVFQVKRRGTRKGAPVLACSLVTNRPARYRLEARARDGAGPWRGVTEYTSAAPKLFEPALRLTVQGGDWKALEFRMRLDVRGENGKWVSRFVGVK
jgi:hypothetical protein